VRSVAVWECESVGVGVWICPARLPVIVLVAEMCYNETASRLCRARGADQGGRAAQAGV